ncbi:RNA 2',3'-cyclic phosphodiesterase [Halobacteriovorax sp. RT-2-6]|uniref:RNA 2',3'-cyclic phosphodiesterase n=1 Tax=unclassified Halobacteriovorax TaxID=2639665 RepID=UPI00399B9827
MRVFVAIDLPKDIKEHIDQISFAHQYFNRYPAANLHLTLKYIGEVSDALLAQINKLMVTIKFSPFPLTFQSLGYFHPHRRGTPLWIGVEHNPQLEKLQTQIEQKLQTLDLKLDNMKYTPHLTIGRMDKGIGEEEIRSFLKTVQIHDFNILVNEFTLFHSHSTKNGVEYIPLATF